MLKKQQLSTRRRNELVCKSSKAFLQSLKNNVDPETSLETPKLQNIVSSEVSCDSTDNTPNVIDVSENCATADIYNNSESDNDKVPNGNCENYNLSFKQQISAWALKNQINHSLKPICNCDGKTMFLVVIIIN